MSAASATSKTLNDLINQQQQQQVRSIEKYPYFIALKNSNYSTEFHVFLLIHGISSICSTRFKCGFNFSFLLIPLSTTQTHTHTHAHIHINTLSGRFSSSIRIFVSLTIFSVPSIDTYALDIYFFRSFFYSIPFYLCRLVLPLSNCDHNQFH